MSMDPNDFLTGGGAPAARFDTIGATVKGTVVQSEVMQQRDIQTGVPKTWPDGNPMMQVVITLQTDLRDPQLDDDDGQRRLFVRGQLQAAVRDALKQAKARLEDGGTLAVQLTGEAPPKQRGFNPQKLFRAQYVPPAPGQAANDPLGVGASQTTPASAPSGGVAADDLI